LVPPIEVANLVLAAASINWECVNVDAQMQKQKNKKRRFMNTILNTVGKRVMTLSSSLSW
jgi:hypothetical protein